ncbi:MAG: hypothetical protein CMJ75_09090 [Planctomycetaceae bacterium]|nr:hypothetical protein [Planctomycetaceae bacterium]
MKNLIEYTRCPIDSNQVLLNQMVIWQGPCGSHSCAGLQSCKPHSPGDEYGFGLALLCVLFYSLAIFRSIVGSVRIGLNGPSAFDDRCGVLNRGLSAR